MLELAPAPLHDGKLLLTPGMLHFWQLCSNSYVRLNLMDVTNVEFRSNFRGYRPQLAGNVIVVSFRNEEGAADEMGFLARGGAG